MTVAIIGDPHIGSHLKLGKTTIGTAINSRLLDQINLLDWCLDQSINACCSDIIITGDTFEDPKVESSIITLFISWLKKCQVYNINVHIIVGNHDILRSGNYYISPMDIISEAELDGVFVYRNMETVFIKNTAYTLMPFRDRKSFNLNSNSEALAKLNESLEYELSSIPLTYKKVIVGHLCLEGALPFGDDIEDMANELICPLDMFKGYDYVWMGHIHKPQVMCDKPHIAHIGSMDISNFGETDHEKILVIHNHDSFEQIKIPTRSLKKINIIVPEGTEDTTAYVLQKINDYDLKDSIVKIEVSMDSSDLLPVNKKQIETVLYKNGTHNISSFSEIKKINSVKKDGKKSFENINELSSIKLYADLYVKEDVKKAFIDLASDLYSEFKLNSKD